MSVEPRLVNEDRVHQALEVKALVTLLHLRVDTAQMLLKVAFNLTLIWLEPRVTYVNLKGDPRYVIQSLVYCYSILAQLSRRCAKPLLIF